MRRIFIAGNWKLNAGTAAEATELARGVVDAVGSEDAVDVAIAPPFTALAAAHAALAGSKVALAAQNMSAEPSGAFTGEISPSMLVDSGCSHVILGHSERRQLFGETDAQVAAKLRAADGAGLVPIVCVGETLEEREAGRTHEVVEGQVSGALAGLGAGEATGLVLAYEPVWAIGTGKTATPDQAQDVHAAIRGWLEGLLGSDRAATTRIQYGGSVKPSNAAELLSQPDIDGALVGGASLKAADFAAIVEAAPR